jgi:hypothetical protein
MPTAVDSPAKALVMFISSFFSTDMSRLFEAPKRHFFATQRPAIVELLTLQSDMSTEPRLSMQMLPSSLPSKDTDEWLPLKVSTLLFNKKRLWKSGVLVREGNILIKPCHAISTKLKNDFNLTIQ